MSSSHDDSTSDEEWDLSKEEIIVMSFDFVAMCSLKTFFSRYV
jgi:hypothetical protein